MSKPSLISQDENSLMQNKSLHLPKEHSAKEYLLSHINKQLQSLQNTEYSYDKKQILNLRKRLIERQGLSLQRIDNLQCIFLHYCTHIFKTGKHMTFDRLQYEKSHMTMQRFFAFLKDFGLTTALIDGVSKQILDKNEVILLFKKVSINCKDLNFEQFISCLDKIGVLYYDSKLNYKAKQQKLIENRKKRKEIYLKSMKRRKAALEAAKMKSSGVQDKNNNEQQEDRVTDQQQPNEQPQKDILQEAKLEEPKNIGNEEQPEKQVEGQVEGQTESKQLPKQIEQQDKSRQQEIAQLKALQAENNPIIPKQLKKKDLFVLTIEEKIEFFYQIINVDNAVSFKKKMRQLNLPIFQTKHRRTATDKKLQGYDSYQPKQQNRVKQTDLQQQKRLQQLKNIIEERKIQIKANQPHMSKEDYQQRRKKRKMDEMQSSIKRIMPRNKKLEVSELQTDLSSLCKMEFQKINFGKFNPQKLIQPSDEDDIYLEQYGSARKPQRSERRILSNLQATDKSSQMLLQKMKKRAQQIQTRQKLEQSKYSIPQDVNITNEHQIRKNRLIQRLLRMQKQ